MRGWIYVAAGGASGRVRIGHAAADPAASQARLVLHYDAVVEAPRKTVELVHARLATLRADDGTVHCTPEFAIAAIHHALGGAPPGERFYGQDDAPDAEAPPPPSAVPVHARREGGGAAHRRLAPGVVALAVACAALLYGGTREPSPPDELPAVVAAADGGPLQTSMSNGAAPPAGPEPPAPDATLPMPPATTSILDCAALWSTLLPRCAALQKAECADGYARLPREAREHIAALHAEVRAFNMTAFENFCRAACRHGYRPARDDFLLTVCSARG